jgi:hypothetical protein
MGYVHDTQSAVVIPPCDMQFAGGVWSDQVSGNQWSRDKTAAAETSTVRVPITGLFQNGAGLKGSLVKSIEIWYEVATLAMTSVGATVYKLAVPADSASPGAPSQPTFAYDTNHNVAGNRAAIAKHKMTLTFSTPIWLDDDDVLFVELALSSAATSVFKMKEVRANFTLRL